MFKPTDVKTSEWRRRLLALIPVVALVLIVASVFVSLRATSRPQPQSSVAVALSEPAAVPAPRMGDAAATAPGTMGRLAQLDAQLYPPARPATATGEMTRLARLDALLYPPARPAAGPSATTRLARLDADLYPPARSATATGEMTRLARLDAELYPNALELPPLPDGRNPNQ